MQKMKKYSLIIILIIIILPLAGCGKTDINEFIKSNIKVEVSECELSDGIWSFFASQQISQEDDPEVQSIKDSVSIMEVKLTNESKKYINSLPLEVTGINIPEGLDDSDEDPWFGHIKMIAAPGDSNTFFVTGFDTTPSEIAIELSSESTDSDDNKISDEYLSSKAKTGYIYPKDVELSTDDITSKKYTDSLYELEGTLDIENKTKKDIKLDQTNCMSAIVGPNNKIDNIYNFDQISDSAITIKAKDTKSVDFTIYAFSENATAEIYFNGQPGTKKTNY